MCTIIPENHNKGFFFPPKIIYFIIQALELGPIHASPLSKKKGTP